MSVLPRDRTSHALSTADAHSVHHRACRAHHKFELTVCPAATHALMQINLSRHAQA